MAEGETGRRGATIMLQELELGTKLRLRNSATGEVVGNPKDGSWIFLKYETSPDPAEVGTEGLVFADDVVEVLD
jgi:hypothetical protein